MIDPTSIASGIATHYTTKALDEKVLPHLNDSLPTESKIVIPPPHPAVLKVLEDIRDSLSPKEKSNRDDPLALQAYPYEYIIDDYWYGYSHVCIFFQTSTPIRIDIPGVGTYLKTVGPGWVQCDVRGRVSTTDSTQHNVIVSYRVDPIGIAL
jgi:hypothetical protein